MVRTSTNPHLHLGNVLWSLWAFATLFFTPVTASFWWSLAIGYPLFLLLFALVHVRPRGELSFYVSAMAMLAFVSMLWNPSAWTYVVFACVYSGLSSAGSVRDGAMRILMIQAVLVVWAWWLDWPWFVMLMAVCVCSSSGFGAMLGYAGRLKDAQLRLSQDEVRRLATTAERERIGRDLHDLLGHTLSLITLKLELSRKLLDRDGEAARRELQEAEKIARNALAEVRAAVTGIRAAGLAGELASARLLLQGSGVQFNYELDVDELPPDVEGALALVLREAVTNIHRHAHARHAEVVLSGDAKEIRLAIGDDGCGGVCTDGNGLGGMRERVQALDGTLEIKSPNRRGTRITVTVPRPASLAAAPPAPVRRSGPEDAMPVSGVLGTRT
jgi:two-component system sensor histidine kinase DesK